MRCEKNGTKTSSVSDVCRSPNGSQSARQELLMILIMESKRFISAPIIGKQFVSYFGVSLFANLNWIQCCIRAMRAAAKQAVLVTVLVLSFLYPCVRFISLFVLLIWVHSCETSNAFANSFETTNVATFFNYSVQKLLIMY